MARRAGAPEYKKTFKSDFGLDVIVTIASILDVEAEAIVIGEDTCIGLQNQGLITKVLIKAIPEFKEKRNELRNKSIKAWSVHKTPLSAFSKFKFVFHAFYKIDNWVNNMIKLYHKVLKKAEKRQIQVLAIPLLGSGLASLNTADCVQALVTAIAQYKPSSLKRVILVSKEWDKADKLSTQCVYQFSPVTKETKSRKSFLGIFSRQSSRTKDADHIGTAQQTATAADTDVQRRQTLPRHLLRSVSAPPDRQTESSQHPQSQKRHAIVSLQASQDQYNNVGDSESRETSEENVYAAIPDADRKRLTEESREYNDVAESFLRDFTNKPTIKKIERIEIDDVRTLYEIKRRQFVQDENHSTSAKQECMLWHHTSEDSSKFISTNGFNRSQCGKDGAAGYGVYFTVSPNSDLEDTYRYSSINDLKYVFRAKVLTGTFTTGTPGHRVPPEREAGVLYDSTVDNVKSPHLYVIYNDTQAYPEYLITFTDNY